MTMVSQKALNAGDWRRLHALGLPAGSVRALLAVVVFATVWGMLCLKPSQEVPDYLSDLMFVIMGHYFATRRRNTLIAAPDDEAGPPPLFLPRGSIRLFLALGSAAVAVLLYQRGAFQRINSNPGVTTLLLVGGFLIGVFLNSVIGWWRTRVKRGHRAIEDFQALAVRRGDDTDRLGLEPPLPRGRPRRTRLTLQRFGPLGPARPRTSAGSGCRVLLRFAVVTNGEDSIIPEWHERFPHAASLAKTIASIRS